MNRRQFTRAISQLLLEISDANDQPIIDYALRSTEEQNRLYKSKLSKCDGYKIKSKHQKGLAVDIYLVNTINGKTQIDFSWTNNNKTKKWHNRWTELGGNKIISWDKGHFEAK